METQDNIKLALIEAFEQIEPQSGSIDGVGEDGFCNWYLREWNNCEDGKKRIKEQAAAMIKAIENRQKGLQYKCGGEFRERITAMVAENPKKKSVKLFQGTAGFRKSPERITFEDEMAVIATCEEHLPSAVKIVKSLVKSEIKKDMLENGVLMSGCELVESVDKFYPQISIPELEGVEL